MKDDENGFCLIHISAAELFQLLPFKDDPNVWMADIAKGCKEDFKLLIVILGIEESTRQKEIRMQQDQQNQQKELKEQMEREIKKVGIRYQVYLISYRSSTYPIQPLED